MGSGEAEFPLGGSGETEPTPEGSGEAEPASKGSDEAVVTPFNRSGDLIVDDHQFPFFGYPTRTFHAWMFCNAQAQPCVKCPSELLHPKSGHAGCCDRS
jgi:hypothetical protein